MKLQEDERSWQCLLTTPSLEKIQGKHCFIVHDCNRTDFYTVTHRPREMAVPRKGQAWRIFQRSSVGIWMTWSDSFKKQQEENENNLLMTWSMYVLRI